MFIAASKQAFEENENEDKLQTEEVSAQAKSSSTTTPASKTTDQDPLYEKAFFTINDLTVEVILDNNMLFWRTVPNESMFKVKKSNKMMLFFVLASVETITSTNPVHKDNTNSVDLHDVYAVTPIHQRSTWLLSNNESSTTMNASNVSTTDSQLRGFQLHTYERMENNILQEILIIFQSISSDLIETWYHLLQKLISKRMNSSLYLQYSLFSI